MSSADHAGFCAWGDESGSVPGIDDDVYLMGAIIATPANAPVLGEAMRDLLLPGQKKVHWHGDQPSRHDAVIDVVSALPLEAVVVVRQGPKTDKDDRRRRKVLEALAPALDGLGCVDLTLESRGSRADKRDREMLDALRARQRVDRLRLTHAPGPSDPLLWVADAVVGAVVAARVGQPQWRRRLENKLTVTEVYGS